ncbi:MAG: hypothetical protein ACKOBH_03545 [bacterium]
MLGAILSGAVTVAASLLVGNAVLLLVGRGRSTAVAPALGISILLILCGITVKLPGRGVTAAAFVVAISLIAALICWRGRRDLPQPTWTGAAVVIGAALVTAIPFAASGRMGILGQGLVNDDMASHLLFAEWLATGYGVTPELIRDGYPLGPHAVVAAMTELVGSGFVDAFAGLTGAIAVLLGLTAMSALPGVRGWLRAPAAVLAAFAYLSAAYHAQGAFKEPLLALSLIGFALSLPMVRAAMRQGPRAAALAAVPAGLISAGTIYNYSFPGPSWLVAAGVAWLLLVAIAERHDRGGLDLVGRLRRTLPVVGTVIGITVVACVPVVVSLLDFTGFRALNPTGPGDRVGYGNLRQPLSPLQALDIWPSSEFRIAPENASVPAAAFFLGALLGAVALALGLRRARGAGERILPATLIAGVVGYLAALAVGTPYTQAKALCVIAPIMMLIALRGFLRAGALEGEPHSVAEEVSAEGGGHRLLVTSIGILFVVAAAFSSFLVLRQAAIGPVGQVQQLIGLRKVVEGEKVLFLGRESFVGWELIGADLYTPIVHNYNVIEVSSLYRPTSTRAKFDFDVVPRKVIERFDYVITTGAAQLSEAPVNFEPIRRTRDYVLWKRNGPLPERYTLIEPIGPGATVDCSDRAVARLSRLDGEARVFTKPPVVGRAWDPTSEPTSAVSATEELPLSAGRWAISLQYASTQPARITAPGLDVALPANLLFRGPAPFYPVGEITVARDGLVDFRVAVGRLPTVGRLLGAESRADLGPIAATPVPAREPVPPSEVCGRYLDWFRLDPGVPVSASKGIPAPTPRRVIEP